MAKPPTNIPPRSKGGSSSRPVPPRPPRKPPPRRRRGGRSQGRFYGLLVGGVIAVAAIVIAVVVTSGGGSGKKVADPAVNWKTPAGLAAYGALGPENVPLQVGAQLAPPNSGLTSAPIDGLQCNSQEQLTYHHHAHLAIFINGKPRAVPIGTGMVPPALVEQVAGGPYAAGSNTCLFWMHVHATDGILHIESPTPKIYELVQFFDIWHVTLTPTQIGTATGHVTATVDGVPWTGDPRQIPLNEHTQVVLNLGGPVVTPPPILWSITKL